MISISEPGERGLAVELRRVRLEKVLQAAAHDFEMRFEFGKHDSIGESHIVLKVAGEQVVLTSYSQLKGRVLHLLGHYLSDTKSWAEAARREESNNRPRFGAFWHALEDARVENWFIQQWPGARKSFEANLLPNLGGSLLALMPLAEQLEMALYLEGRGYSGAVYHRRVRAVLSGLGDAHTRAARGQSARDTFAAMQEIYPKLALCLQPPGDTSRSSPSSGQTSFGEDAGDRELDHKLEAHSGELSLDGILEYIESDNLASVRVQGRRQELPEWFRPGSVPWFESGLGDKKIHPTVLQSDRQTIVDPPKGDNETYRLVRAEIQRETGYLAHRLTNLIREEIYLRFGGRYRSGELNMAKLWKQRGGDYRLFQRPVTGTGRGVAFTLLVDESASMRGQDKSKIAMKAAVLLGETLELLGAPLEIIGYTTAEYEAQAAMKLGLNPPYQYRTTRCSPLEHRLYKRFAEPYNAARARLTGIEPRRNNWDEEHLVFAFRRLQERGESKKVLIVIGDGQPNGDASHLIHTVQRIESLGVRVVGIGIGADYVRQIYQHAIVVANFRQMAEELLQILARELHAG